MTAEDVIRTHTRGPRMRSYEEENITSPSRSIVVGGGERES